MCGTLRARASPKAASVASGWWSVVPRGAMASSPPPSVPIRSPCPINHQSSVDNNPLLIASTMCHYKRLCGNDRLPLPLEVHSRKRITRRYPSYQAQGMMLSASQRPNHLNDGIGLAGLWILICKIATAVGSIQRLLAQKVTQKQCEG